jgi:uncharacterized protein YbjT (DUF2867 family)
MSRIFVTGATGFVGSHLVRTLLEEGHGVSALVRPVAATAALPRQVRVSRGDVLDQASVSRALAEVEVVVHLASGYGDDASEIIVRGSENVGRAAVEAGVERLVFLSCLPANAASPSAFFRAKWLAEQSVRALGVPYVILRPSLVLGRGDSVTRPLADLTHALPVIPIPGSGRQRHQPIDVEDLCRCIAQAVSSPRVLNSEIAVGGPMFVTFRQLVDLIQGAVGTARPKVLVPLTLARRAAGLLPASTRELYSDARLAVLEETSAASPGIVEREFGFTPGSVVERLGSYLEPVDTLS